MSPSLQFDHSLFTSTVSVVPSSTAIVVVPSVSVSSTPETLPEISTAESKLLMSPSVTLIVTAPSVPASPPVNLTRAPFASSRLETSKFRPSAAVRAAAVIACVKTPLPEIASAPSEETSPSTLPLLISRLFPSAFMVMPLTAVPVIDISASPLKESAVILPLTTVSAPLIFNVELTTAPPAPPRLMSLTSPPEISIEAFPVASPEEPPP